MMAGFRSKRMMSAGSMAIASPTWQDHLRVWEQAAISRYLYDGSSSNANQDIISDCMDQMQILFPGNYTLVWHCPEPNEHHLTVHFEDPKHEILWRLKNT